MKFKQRDRFLVLLMAIAVFVGAVYVWAGTTPSASDLTIQAGSTYTVNQNSECNNLLLEGTLLISCDNSPVLTVDGNFTASGDQACIKVVRSDNTWGEPNIIVKGVSKGTATLDVGDWVGFPMDKINVARTASNDINLNIKIYSSDGTLLDTQTVTRLRIDNGLDSEPWFCVNPSGKTETKMLLGDVRYYKVSNAIIDKENVNIDKYGYYGFQIHGGNSRGSEISKGSSLDVVFSNGTWRGWGSFYGGGRTNTEGNTYLNVEGKVGSRNDTNFYGGGHLRQVSGTSSVVFNAIAASVDGYGNALSDSHINITGGTEASENQMPSYGSSVVTIKKTGDGMIRNVIGGSCISDIDSGDVSEPSYIDAKSAAVTLEAGNVKRLYGGGWIDGSYGKSLKRLTFSDGVNVTINGGTVAHDVLGLGLVELYAKNYTEWTKVPIGYDKGQNILGTNGPVTINVTGGNFNNRDIRACGSVYTGDDYTSPDLNYDVQTYAGSIKCDINNAKAVRRIKGGAQVDIGNNQSTSKVSNTINGDVTLNIGGSTEIIGNIVGGSTIGSASYNYKTGADAPVALKGSASATIGGSIDITLSGNTTVGGNIELSGHNGEDVTGNVPTNVVKGNATLTIKENALKNFSGRIYGHDDSSAKLNGIASVVFDGWSGEFGGWIRSVDKVIVKNNSNVSFLKSHDISVPSGGILWMYPNGYSDLVIEAGSTVTIDKYYCSCKNIAVNGTLIISGDNEMLDAQNVTLGANAKIIIRGNNPIVKFSKVTGSVAANPFSFGSGTSNAGFSIGDTSGLKIGGKAIATSLKLNDYSLKKDEAVSLDKLLAVTPSGSNSYTLLWDTLATSNAKVLSIDKTKESLTALASGKATLAMSADIFNSARASLSCTVTVTTAPTQLISSDVNSKDLPGDTVIAGTRAASSDEVSTDVSSIAALKNNVVPNGSGVLVVTPSATKEFIAGVAKTDSTVNSADAVSLAMIVASYSVKSDDLKTVVLAKELTGSDFPAKASTFGKLKVIKLGKDGAGTVLKMVTSADVLSNGCYLLKDSKGVTVTSDTAIDTSEVYTMSLAILDNGSFDIDSKAGTVIDPLFLTSTADATTPATPTNPTTPDSGSGGGGGCNAGFAGLLLLAEAPLFLRRKK